MSIFTYIYKFMIIRMIRLVLMIFIKLRNMIRRRLRMISIMRRQIVQLIRLRIKTRRHTTNKVTNNDDNDDNNTYFKNNKHTYDDIDIIHTADVYDVYIYAYIRNCMHICVHIGL